MNASKNPKKEPVDYRYVARLNRAVRAIPMILLGIVIPSLILACLIFGGSLLGMFINDVILGWPHVNQYVTPEIGFWQTMIYHSYIFWGSAAIVVGIPGMLYGLCWFVARTMDRAAERRRAEAEAEAMLWE
jgi:hypothetical protein